MLLIRNKKEEIPRFPLFQKRDKRSYFLITLRVATPFEA